MKCISNSIILCAILSIGKAQAFTQAIPVVLGTVTVPACVFYNYLQSYWRDREIVRHVEKYATSDIAELCRSCKTNTNPGKACGDCKYFGNYLHAIMVESENDHHSTLSSRPAIIYLCKDTLQSFGIKAPEQHTICNGLDAKIVNDMNK